MMDRKQRDTKKINQNFYTDKEKLGKYSEGELDSSENDTFNYTRWR